MERSLSCRSIRRAHLQRLQQLAERDFASRVAPSIYLPYYCKATLRRYGDNFPINRQLLPPKYEEFPPQERVALILTVPWKILYKLEGIFVGEIRLVSPLNILRVSLPTFRNFKDLGCTMRLLLAYSQISTWQRASQWFAKKNVQRCLYTD